MRPVQQLTFDAFRDRRATTFTAIADQRAPRRIPWALPAVRMSALALVFWQQPSLWAYQRRRQQRTGRSHLERGCQVEELPAETQRREIVDGGPTAPVRRVVPQTCDQRRRGGWTTRFVTEVGGTKHSRPFIIGENINRYRILKRLSVHTGYAKTVPWCPTCGQCEDTWPELSVGRQWYCKKSGSTF